MMHRAVSTTGSASDEARAPLLKPLLVLTAVVLALTGCAANQQMVAHMSDAEAFLARAAAAMGTQPPGPEARGRLQRRELRKREQ